MLVQLKQVIIENETNVCLIEGLIFQIIVKNPQTDAHVTSLSVKYASFLLLRTEQ